MISKAALRTRIREHTGADGVRTEVIHHVSLVVEALVDQWAIEAGQRYVEEGRIRIRQGIAPSIWVTMNHWPKVGHAQVEIDPWLRKEHRPGNQENN